jgi:hypothetical protein
MKPVRGILLAIAIPVMIWAQSLPGSWEGAYHAAPPAKNAKLPPILTRSQLVGDVGQPYQRRAYEAAARNSSLLYQLPCKCHCDREGHTSLRSCFESLHGAGCYVCMKEAVYADQQVGKGKTAAQIRAGINRGEHNGVELE